MMKGEFDKALEKYYQSLVVAEEVGDQAGIANTLNNTRMIYDKKGEYEDALYNVFRVYEILKRDGISDFQQSLAIISRIREKIGTEDFNILEDKVKRKIGGLG